MKKREEFFNKEIGNLKKKEATLLKRLEKLDPPKEEGKNKEETKGEKITAKGGAKKDKPTAAPGKSVEKKKKKEPDEDEKKKKEAEEQERIRKEEEERKKKEEEEAAKKAEEEKKAKGAAKPAPGKPGAKVEEKKEEVPVVETEE